MCFLPEDNASYRRYIIQYTAIYNRKQGQRGDVHCRGSDSDSLLACTTILESWSSLCERSTGPEASARYTPIGKLSEKLPSFVPGTKNYFSAGRNACQGTPVAQDNQQPPLEIQHTFGRHAALTMAAIAAATAADAEVPKNCSKPVTAPPFQKTYTTTKGGDEIHAKRYRSGNGRMKDATSMSNPRCGN